MARHDGLPDALPRPYVLAAPCPGSQSEDEVAAVARGRAHAAGRRRGRGGRAGGVVNGRVDGGGRGGASRMNEKNVPR